MPDIKKVSRAGRSRLRGKQTERQTDPTRTKTIRARYEAAAVRRFRKLERDLIRSIVINDAFGIQLIEDARRRRDQFAGLAEALRGQFFDIDPTVALRRFNRWLSQQIDDEILEVINREGAVVTSRNEWQNEFVQASAKRAIEQTHANVARVGVEVTGTVEAALVAPIHARTLQLLFQRNFSVLEGITADMERRIQRVIAQGLADGTGVIPMGRALRREIDISINRARMMARTETINAHATTTLNELQRAGFVDVRADVEFSSTGDGRVCVRCQALDGKIFTIAEARGVIPQHPNCRCSWIPANIGEDRKARRDASNRRKREITRRRKVLAEAA